MLRQRIITALILGPLLLWVVVWAPTPITISVIAAALLIGAWEWAQFCVGGRLAPRLLYVVAIGVVMAAAWRFSSTSANLSSLFSVAIVWWIAAFAWLALAPTRVNATLAALAGAFVLVPTWLALSRLHDAGERGPMLVLFLLVLVFAADIGAYFAGRAFGRLKLAPRVSPGKTWEGVFGGFAAATLVAVAGAYFFEQPMLTFLILCGAVVTASIIGDLTESMFKRHAGLKDSSNLLPGHGGILDRIDSITAASPTFALGMMWLGVLQ